MNMLCRDLVAYLINNHCSLLDTRSLLWVSSLWRSCAVDRFHLDLVNFVFLRARM